MTFSPLHPQFTEAFICRCLDGTVTKVDYDGRVHTILVEPSYIPPYGGKATGGREIGQKISRQIYWTPEEEELLIRQRLLNRPFAEIAWSLDRSVEAVKKHHHLLRARGLA